MGKYGLSAEIVIEACNGDLEDKVFFHGIYGRLINGREIVAPDYEEMTRQYIRELREQISVADQTKIVYRFTELAREARCNISNFRWWDIVPRDHLLLADLVREGRDISLMFYWKRTDKSLSSIMLWAPSPRVLKDFKPPRVEFEAATYQEVKGHFKAWLAAPFSLEVKHG